MLIFSESKCWILAEFVFRGRDGVDSEKSAVSQLKSAAVDTSPEICAAQLKRHVLRC